MQDENVSNLRPLAPGIVLSLLSIIFGFVLGGAFGAAEDSIKGHLKSSGEEVLESVYKGDADKMNAVVAKSWSYMKRAHLHGGAIGAAALASIVLLGLFGSPGPLERISSTLFGAGALLYASFWLFAGLSAPGIGSTGGAKEALQFLAIPGAGMCLLGVFGTLVCVVRRLRSA